MHEKSRHRAVILIFLGIFEKFLRDILPCVFSD